MNIVFDLGGVVVTWNPQAIAAGVFADPADQALACRGVFGHPDWLEVDRGALDYGSAAVRAAARTGLSQAQLAAMINAVPASLTPISATIDLMHELKQRGHALYCLSNMGQASIEHLEKAHGFWEVFSGAVISCRLRLCKPEPAIFRHLLDSYSLQPGDTVFIDDTVVNVEAAARLGIRTVRFESAAQCERELRALGCLGRGRGL